MFKLLVFWQLFLVLNVSVTFGSEPNGSINYTLPVTGLSLDLAPILVFENQDLRVLIGAIEKLGVVVVPVGPRQLSGTVLGSQPVTRPELGPVDRQVQAHFSHPGYLEIKPFTAPKSNLKAYFYPFAQYVPPYHRFFGPGDSKAGRLEDRHVMLLTPFVTKSELLREFIKFLAEKQNPDTLLPYGDTRITQCDQFAGQINRPISQFSLASLPLAEFSVPYNLPLLAYGISRCRWAVEMDATYLMILAGEKYGFDLDQSEIPGHLAYIKNESVQLSHAIRLFKELTRKKSGSGGSKDSATDKILTGNLQRMDLISGQSERMVRWVESRSTLEQRALEH